MDIRELIKKANEGDAKSQYELALRYIDGDGVKQNYYNAALYARMSADQNYPEGMNLFGNLLFNGTGVSQNQAEAVEWYRKAAEQGYDEAQDNLGGCYYIGKGVEQSYEKAVEWYRKAAEQGYDEAQNSLASCYYNGKGVEQSYEKAAEWWLKAAEQGDADAQYNLALCYKKGEGVEQSYEKAAEWYRKAAEQGHPMAQCKLGECYEKGEGVEQSFTEAVMWYRKVTEEGNGEGFIRVLPQVKQSYIKLVEYYRNVAEQGDASAQCFLGKSYYDGYGVEQSYGKAAELYRKAAEQGCDQAQNNLGGCYYNGYGVEQSYEKAVMWYRKAAEQGYANAQCNLGVCYEKGEGVEQSFTEAVKWYRKAAEQGLAQAQCNLGYCYEMGRGVVQSYGEAVKWYRKAAELGYAMAQTALGACYENGEGVEQSYEKAAEWYYKAAKQGDEEALIALQLLEGESAEKFEKDYEISNAGKRYDLFVSWNHEDKEFKDELVKGIEHFNFSEVEDKEQKIYTHYRAWESDRDASGGIERCIENAISNSKFFLVILSENSIKSKWVEKEVQMALDMVKSKKWSEENLLVVYLNTKKFDVGKEISKMEETSVFRKLCSHSANFAMDKCDEKTVSAICGKIKTGLQRAAIANYRYHMTDGNSSFKYSLRNQYVNSELSSMGSIVEALLSFEEGYIERSVYKVPGDIETSLSDLAKSKESFFLVGEGGTGKSLYLSNMMRKYFGDKNFFLRVNLIDYEKEIAAIGYLTDLLAKELNRYLVDSDEYRSRNIVDRAREDFGHLTIMFDGLDETGRETKEKLISLIEGYKCINLSDRFIFTSRTSDCFDNMQAVFGGSLKLYRLEGFDENQCIKLYQNIEKKMVKDKKDSDKAKSAGKDIDLSMFNVGEDVLKNNFFVNLKSLGDEIKKNPMLLSNLIFIYLKNQGRDFPTHKYEVIDKSIGIFLNDLEEDRGIKMRFKYHQYLTPDRMKDMLGNIAFRKLQGNTKDFGELLKEYFNEDRCQNGDNYEDVAIAVYDYLSRRAIISTDKITHDIFTAFFACCYIFDKIYKLYRNDLDIENWQFRKGDSYSGKDYLEKHLKGGVLKRGDGMWPEICAELLMKLDYEINAVSRESMDAENPNYAVFDETLTKTLKDKGFSDAAIETVRELAERNNGFYYVEFLRKYLPA